MKIPNHHSSTILLTRCLRDQYEFFIQVDFLIFHLYVLQIFYIVNWQNWDKLAGIPNNKLLHKEAEELFLYILSENFLTQVSLRWFIIQLEWDAIIELTWLRLWSPAGITKIFSIRLM